MITVEIIQRSLSEPPPSQREDAKPDNSLGELLDRVLDGETGIVRFVSLTDLQADEPPLFVGMAEMVDTRKMSPRRVSSQSPKPARPSMKPD
jgi:hypothetical protein